MQSKQSRIKVNNTIKQIDEKFIPDTIARKSEIPETAQPDWNQNDETSPDYVKNRTHYSEIVTVSETRELFMRQPLIDEEFAQLLYENRHTALYTVGGKSFTFSNDEASPIGYGWIIISDDGETNEVNICPSVPPIDPSNPESTVYDAILSSANTVFTVNYEKEVVHLIDEKFLPEHSWNNLEDKPFYEIEPVVVLDETVDNGFTTSSTMPFSKTYTFDSAKKI